jgi:hypothetical protein
MADEPEDQPANKAQPEPPKKSRVTRILIATGSVLAVAGTVIAAIINGVFATANKAPDPTPPPTVPAVGPTSTSETSACNGFRVEVLYPSETGPQPKVTFTIRCAPEGDRKFVRVIEAEDIGADHHKEFYPKDVLPSQPGATVTYAIDVSRDKIGDTNCVYAISVTPAQLEQIQSNLDSHNLTTNPLPGAQRESRDACGRRQY